MVRVICSRCRQDLNFGDFTLLFCPGGGGGGGYSLIRA